MNKTPSVLLYDLETSPRKVWVWAEYEQSVLRVAEESYILCFAYKWLGESETHVVSLNDFPGYKRSKKNDKDLVKRLYELIDEADIVIGQNSDRFDNKWANKQFIKHGLSPISPYKSIDTLKIAKKHFRFDSNKLGRLGEFLGVGNKETHHGLSTWFDVMDGDKDAWLEMKKYVKQDVVLLEKVYMKLRPWMETHPNFNAYNAIENIQCPVCQSDRVQSRGWSMKGRFSRAKRYQCQSCGKWSQSATERIKEVQIS